MAKTTTKKQTAKSKTVSAAELKSWLRGAMEFQPDNWTPSAEQWATIRDRIFNLEEVDFIEQTVTVSPQVPYYGHAPAPATQVWEPVHPRPRQAQGADTSSTVTGNPEGAVATTKSPTESGLIPVSREGTVLEGEYKSPF